MIKFLFFKVFHPQSFASLHLGGVPPDNPVPTLVGTSDVLNIIHNIKPRSFDKLRI